MTDLAHELESLSYRVLGYARAASNERRPPAVTESIIDGCEREARKLRELVRGPARPVQSNGPRPDPHSLAGCKAKFDNPLGFFKSPAVAA